jgi:hypothetical protein
LKSKAERAFLALAGKPGDDHFLTALETPRLRRPFRALHRFGVTDLLALSRGKAKERPPRRNG